MRVIIPCCYKMHYLFNTRIFTVPSMPYTIQGVIYRESMTNRLSMLDASLSGSQIKQELVNKDIRTN